MADAPDTSGALTGDEAIPPKLAPNPGFVADGQPYQPPPDAAARAYEDIEASGTETFGAQITQASPLSWLGRAVERGTQAGSSGFDQFLGHMGEGEAASAGVVPNAAGEPVQSRMLTADEANEKYAPEGTKITDGPIPDGLAQIIGRQKSEEIRRDAIIQRFQNNNAWPINTGVGIAAFMLDPLNIATNFVPGLGEATTMAAVGRIGMTGLAARMVARGVAGGTAMAAQQIPLTAMDMALGREQASDYGMRDALTSVFYGAVFGAAWHAGFGGLREAGLLRPDHLMAPRELPGPAEPTRPGGPPPLPDSTLLGPHADALEREVAAEPEARGPIDLAEHGFTPADIAALHADGLADADGNMSPEQVAAWREEREVRAPPTPEMEPEPAEAHVPPDAASVSLPAHAHADAMTAAVAEVLDERPVDVTPVVEQAHPTQESPTPADVSAQQADHARNGHVTGIPDKDLRETTAAIYHPEEKVEKPAGEAEKPEAKPEEEKPGAKVVPAAAAPKPPELAPEPDRERTTAPKPVYDGKDVEPAALQRLADMHEGYANRATREAGKARTATARAAKRDEAANDAAIARAMRSVLGRWKADHPDEAARIFGDVEPAAPEPAAAKPVGMSLVETTHTKHGYPLFVVTTAERLPRDRYNALLASAKEGGGYYSTFKGQGAVPGFTFRTREAAETFLRKERGEPAEVAAPHRPITTHDEPNFIKALKSQFPNERVPTFDPRTGTRRGSKDALDFLEGWEMAAADRPRTLAHTGPMQSGHDAYGWWHAEQPAPAPRAAPTAAQWTEIGKNHIGQTLYEDQRGARSYIENGVRITEPVSMRPTREGMQIEVAQPDDKAREFRRLDEPMNIRPLGNRWVPTPEEQARIDALPPPNVEPLPPEAAPRRFDESYGANNKLVTREDADAIRARLRAKAAQLRTGIDPEMMLDGARLAVFHIEAGTRAFADYAREMVADVGHEFRPYLRSWYEAARHWPGVDSTGLSSPAEIDAALERMGPHEAAGELNHEEADRLLDSVGKPEADHIAQSIADGRAPEDIATTSELTVAEVRGVADALDRRGEIPEPTAEAEPIDYSEHEMRDWWDKLPPEDRELARVGTEDWDELHPREQDKLFEVRQRWDATERRQQSLALETPDGVQEPLPPRDEGAGTADVQPTAAVGTDGRPPPAEVGGGPRTPETTAGPGAEEQVRGELPGGRAGGRGEGAGDTDRVPGEGEPRPQGTAGRPAPDALVKGQNYTIEPGALAESRGRITKARGNLEAIELAKRLITEDRPATKAEQDILARYVGWGGLKGAFDVDGQFGKGLEAIGGRLKELLSEDEYRTAARSVQYAHYTSETVVRAMWDAVRGMGFKEGSVFEPGMGIGHFLGLMPPDIAAKARYQGIEMDKLTASIAKLLYPKSGVRNADFIRTAMPADHFDLAIGNPPFSDVVVQADPKYAARGFMLHDYFFAKSMDSVRPGGILGFISSAGTMNKLDAGAREYLAERAEFLGGVRLPNNAFAEGAGTKVTTDVLFFRKLDAGETAERNQGWTETVQRTLPDKNGNPVQANVSRYFSEHPEQVLGREGMTDELVAGPRYAVDPEPGQDFPAELRAAMDRLPKDVLTEPQTPEARAALDFASGQKKDGSFYIGENGELRQYRDGAGREVPRRGKGETGGFTAAEMDRIQHLIPMRDALRDVFAADLAKDDAAGVEARARLNEHYDRFVEKFGPVNKAEFQYRRPTLVQQETARLEAREEARSQGDRFDDGDFDPEALLRAKAKITDIARARQAAREAAGAAGRQFNEGEFDPADMPDVVFERRPNIKPFMGDPESYRLRSIEKYNDATGEAEKRAIFTRNILADKLEPEIRSANDGVLWSLNQHGRLDLDAIAAKMGRERVDIIRELGDSIYKVPGTADTFQTKDEYLSGDVVTKLEQARAAGESDPEVRRNIAALEAAVPAPLPPSDISMRLGMPWIPEESYARFIEDHLELGPARVVYNRASGTWFVDTPHAARSEGAAKWGTQDREAADILSDAMNRTPPRIYEPPDRDGRRAFDPVATQAAVDKFNAIKGYLNNGVWVPGEFDHWLNADAERLDTLAGLYNDALNRTVLRQYDGSYLTTPGVASDWSWRPHQTRVVARIVQSGNTYMAHAVGAGKTSAMIGAGMEMRRLGIARKPLYVVPNHMLGQFTKEFYEQYPTARIAVADEERFHTSRRKQFVANVAQDDLDAIIMTHSSFGKIPLSEEFQGNLIQEQLDMLTEALTGMRDAGAPHYTIRRLENQKQKLEEKLAARTSATQDQTINFEQMGADFAFIDEAHEFRKLPFSSKQGNLKGISPEGSAKAWDLYGKMRYLDDQKPGQSHVFASGTPITNTMGEMYSLSRFMQGEALKDRGISHFDSWAQMFGDVSTSLEENAAGGYQPVTRFNQFVNMPELYKMVGEVMDIVTPNQLEQYVTRPKLAGGARQLHMAPRTDILDRYQADLGARMQAIKDRRGPPQKGDDILLSVINDGRHAAIDPRFVEQTQNDPRSKLNMMIANVVKTWRETADHEFFDPTDGYKTSLGRGPAAQMIFANLGVNGRGPMGFSTYQWIKEALRREGIPPDQVAFIGDYGSTIQRQALFNDVNQGKVRVLVGSTQKMGTGVNAQKRLVAIHNLDPLWYPADDEQRVGRGLRQGNTNPELQVHDYTTKGTYDSAMWGMMGKKARFIEQFFRGDPELRTMEDLGEASMYEQASAMSTTDERMITLTDMRQELDKAMRRESAYEREQYAARTKVKQQEWWVDHSTKRAAETAQDIAQRVDTRGDAFAMNVAGERFTTRKEAAEALGKVLEDRVPAMGKGATQTIGNIGGFPIQVVRRGAGSRFDYQLRMNGGQTVDLTGSVSEPMRLIQSAEYRLRNLEDVQAGHLQTAEHSRQQAETARKQISTAPNPHVEDVARLRKSVSDLEEQMRPPTEQEMQARREAAATEASTQAKFSRDLFGEPRAKEGEEGEAESDPEMEEAEQQLAALQQHLSLEDMDEIHQATSAVDRAEQTAAALTEAAACLRGAE